MAESEEMATVETEQSNDVSEENRKRPRTDDTETERKPEEEVPVKKIKLADDGKEAEAAQKETEIGNADESEKKETEIGNADESEKKETEIGNADESEKKETEIGNADESEKKETEIGYAGESEKKEAEDESEEKETAPQEVQNGDTDVKDTGEEVLNAGTKTEDQATEGDKEKAEEKKQGPVKLGPKTFSESVQMFDYFYNLLHVWPANIYFNKYERLVLEDLLMKGHHEAEKKVSPGLRGFQVRPHPEYGTRCFCFIRADDIIDDFSYRRCVDSLMPLPDHLKLTEVGKNEHASGGHRGGRGGRGRHGRGRGRGRS